MSLLNAFNIVAKLNLKPFIAPVFSKNDDLFTLQNNVPFWTKFQGDSPGWYLIDEGGKPARAAYPYEYLPYMKALPKFACIYVPGPVPLVVPFNADDAAQRSWPSSKPRLLELPRGDIKPLSVIYCVDAFGRMVHYRKAIIPRSSEDVWAARTLVDNQRRVRGNFELASSLTAHYLEQERRKKLGESTEGRFRQALEKSGSDLVEFEKVGDRYKVTYQYQGMEWSVVIDQNLRGISAGICLSGTDANYSLASLPLVMQRARELRRFDLDRKYHL